MINWVIDNGGPNLERHVSQEGVEQWNLYRAPPRRRGQRLRGVVKESDLGTCSLFPGLLSAHFLSMDRYRSSAHFADFQDRSSLIRSQKTSG